MIVAVVVTGPPSDPRSRAVYIQPLMSLTDGVAVSTAASQVLLFFLICLQCFEAVVLALGISTLLLVLRLVFTDFSRNQSRRLADAPQSSPRTPEKQSFCFNACP